MPCLHGDCLVIEFHDSTKSLDFRIFIDSGFSSTYAQTLRKKVTLLQAQSKAIDLFILTHSDSDHIGGIVPFLREFGTHPVREFWYNYSPLDIRVPDLTEQVGVAQGVQLRDWLQRDGKLPSQPITSGQTYSFTQANLTVLSPKTVDFERYAEVWRKQEEQFRNDSTLIGTKQSDHHKSVEELSQRPFALDTSLSNRSSIALLIEFGETVMLFTSDSHPDVLVASLEALGYSPTNPLRLDLMQVPHHGSRGNINPELLDLIDCRHFLLSTNASNSHRFPHKEALARVITSAHGKQPHEPIWFYFPYAEKKLQDLFSPAELARYHIIIQYPVADELGIVLRFPH